MVTNENGEITNISLQHYQGVKIFIPAGGTITVTETSYGDYHPSHKIKSGASGTFGNSVSSATTGDIYMNGDKYVEFTNSTQNEIVAPTGYISNHIPFLLLLLIGIFLFGVSGWKYRTKLSFAFHGNKTNAIQDVVQEEETIYIGKHTAREETQITTNQQYSSGGTNVKGYSPDNIWVNHTPTIQGAFAQQRVVKPTAPTCPRENLWVKGPPGERGGVG